MNELQPRIDYGGLHLRPRDRVVQFNFEVINQALQAVKLVSIGRVNKALVEMG